MRRGFRNKLKKNFKVTVKKKKPYHVGYVPGDKEKNTVLLAPAWMVRQVIVQDERKKSRDERRQRIVAAEEKQG